jgi:XTP/dITP diphosphohydrolase
VPLRPKLLIATNNSGKLKELTGLLAGSPYTPVSLADVGISEEVAETGATFEENATIKANSYARMGAILTLADDSGLEVAALGGEPGVLSARYAGEGADDSQRIAYLLDKLHNVDEADRTARFRCVIALATPGGDARLFSGECKGRILRRPRGENGFGYDPVFLPEGLGKTMAELTEEEKNGVSHRSVAVRKAAVALGQMALA